MAVDGKVNRLYKFFGKDGPNPTLAGFAAEFKALTDADKAQLFAGIEDGSLTY